jgi:CBS-domain-containing membrane protein
MLPLIDQERKLVGVVSETDMIAAIGQVEQWVSPIKKFVNPNVVSYPVATPVRKIVDFLNRTSVRRVMIVQDGVLIGYICRTPLLRWLRNQWAAVSGKYGDIIPKASSREVLTGNLRAAIDALREELTNVDMIVSNEGAEDYVIQDRGRMVSLLSQCQDVMDQVLRYGSIPTVNDSAVLSSE